MTKEERSAGARPLSIEDEAFLRALARVAVYVPRVLEADLARDEGLSSSEFFALMHVSEAPGGHLRMGDLAARSALSPGAVTRVVKALEVKGLVERHPCPSDGRGHDAVLTETGRARLEQVRPAQVASARRRVFDKLAGVDLRTCTDVLDRIVQDDYDQQR